MKQFERYIKLFFFFILFILSTSCSNKLTYLKDIDLNTKDTIVKQLENEYLLKESDVLYVKIYTMDDNVNSYFNPQISKSNSGNEFEERAIYFQGYSINDSGYIKLPVIGSIKVAGLTMNQCKQIINIEARKYIKDPQVIVRFANFRITVLGEVNDPGVKMIYDEKLSILEALGYAGDITYNGNREKVLLLRSTNEGTKSILIDVTSKDLLLSQYYYLEPNDLLYIQPHNSTLIRERSSDYVFYISALSTTLSTLLLILTVIK